LAREELPDAHPARVDVDAAIASSRRATSLTRQLLTFGRRQFLEATRVDLNMMVEDTRDMLARLVGERVRLETRLSTGVLPVNADATQLQQVLMNLVVNARDAMPEGGTIVIDTKRVPDVIGSRAELTVSDTGHGMSADTRSRVFEPFFTTKARGQGTGLGLSIAHGIVVQAGGSIELDSMPGKGTRVRVYIPLMAETTERVAAISQTPGTEQRCASILLVEDEAPVRNAVRRMLEHAGHRVIEAQHAEDALVQWQRAEVPFDVLLTDLMMPGIDGWALLRMLREDQPSLCAVVMSGYTGTSDVAERLNDGAVTLTLSKPFGARELTETVQRALETASLV
jgi:CheY-like chemotaxis protein